MKFTLPSDIKENIIDLMRKAGYISLGRGKDPSELSFVRSLRGQRYPRFHLFVRSDKGRNIVLNLHLDQKAPIYKGTIAHSGDYESPILEEEAERIKNSISL